MTTMIRKALTASIDTTASGFTATITAETLDRDGEVLIPAGMNSREFDTNPVLFWNHDYSKPVGRAVGLKRRERDIVGDFVFAKRPDGYQGEFFPEVAAALVGQGIVRGVSVGYAAEPNGTRRATDVDRKKYGDMVHTIFSRWKLLEISLAPLQCNPDALITAVKKGMISPGAAKAYFGIDAPKRTVVTIEMPALSDSSRADDRPIDVAAIVRREVARRKGALYA
jgi:HK97 family phage prohead protease